MRIIMNGTTITGSVSEVLATLTHLGFKASDTTAEVTANDTAKSVTMGQVAGITVTDPEDMEKVAESIVAAMRTRGLVTPADDAVAIPIPAPKLTRDSVIKMAIADVKDLLSREYYASRGGDGVIVESHVGNGVDFRMGGISDRVDFFINASKGAVVAKLTFDTASKPLKDRTYETEGRAKCAPGDVFNEHIGKAIALRRALGLEVPVEYFTVEARDRDDLAVGDVVKVHCDGEIANITELFENLRPNDYPGQAFLHDLPGGFLASSQVTLINDSARHTAPDLEVSRIIRH